MAKLDFATRALAWSRANAPAAFAKAKQLYAEKGAVVEKVAAVQNAQSQGNVVQTLAENGMDIVAFRQSKSLTEQEEAMFSALFAKYEKATETALNVSAVPVQGSGDANVDFIAQCKDIKFALNATSLSLEGFLRLAEVMRTITTEKADRFAMAQRMGVNFTA